MANGQGVTDLVPHLRTVHFALLLACILTLLSTMVGRRGEVSEAYHQLQKVQAMRNSWNRWTQKFSLEQVAWLRMLGIQWLAPEPQHAYIDLATLPPADLQPFTRPGVLQGPGYVLGVHLVGIPLHFHLPVKDRPSDLLLAVPYGDINKSDVFPLELTFPGEDSGSRPFMSITDFREFWVGARLPMVTFLHRIFPDAYLVIDGAIRSEFKMRALEGKERSAGTWTFRTSRFGGCSGLDLVLFRTHARNTDANALFCADQEPGRLVILADLRTARVPVDLRQWLIKEFDLDGAGGEFSKMFPELDKVTSVFQTLDTDKIDQILRAELHRQGDRVQFLGISLPEPAMASWGMIVVLATHTYFWRHLRAFKRAEAASPLIPVTLPRRDTPQHAWISLYKDWWASVVTILTVSIVPLGVVIRTGFFVSSWPRQSSVLITLIVLALAVDSARLLVGARLTAMTGKLGTIVVHYWLKREARVTPAPSQDAERS